MGLRLQELFGVYVSARFPGYQTWSWLEHFLTKILSPLGDHAAIDLPQAIADINNLEGVGDDLIFCFRGNVLFILSDGRNSGAGEAWIGLAMLTL